MKTRDVFMDPEPVTLELTLGELRLLAGVLMRTEMCSGSCGKPECELLDYVYTCICRKVSLLLVDGLPETFAGTARDHAAARTARLDQWHADLSARGLLP